METKTLVIAAVLIAATAAMAIAPLLTGTVLARKQETIKCTNGASSHECRGSSDEGAGATITTKCAAGKDFHNEHPTCP